MGTHAARFAMLCLAGFLAVGTPLSADAAEAPRFPPPASLPAAPPAVAPPNLKGVTPPDLIVSAVSNPPAFASPGGAIAVTDTTGNPSQVPAPTTLTRYFLSADQSAGDDIALGGQRQVPQGLVSGGSHSGTVNAAIPPTTPPGSYYLAACADAGGLIPENNERNNCRFSATRVTVGFPDLAEVMVSAPRTGVPPGWTVPIGYKTANLSPIPASRATVTKYYASTDFTVGNDLYLGERPVPSGLASGAESFGTHQLKIPANVPPGFYHLLACSDGAGAMQETNEENNCRFDPQKMAVGLADLTVASLSNPPAVAAHHDNIVVTDTARNLSPIPPNATVVTSYFLSADLAVGDDIRLYGDRTFGERKVGEGLVAGADSTGTVAVWIHPSTPLGLYHLLACTDAGGFVTESNEGNNCLFSQTRIHVDKPDLVVAAVSTAATSVPYGGRFTVTDTTQNVGKVPVKVPISQNPSGAIITKYYLATDLAMNGAVSAGTRQVPWTLAAGAVDTVTSEASVPPSTALGTYYLFACADRSGGPGAGPGGMVHESNEGNNCTAAAKPLVVRNPQAGDVF